MKTALETVTHTLHSKLQNLVSFLSQITEGFDSISEEIDNINLRSAMRAIAVESKQYAREINNQFHQFNIYFITDPAAQVWQQFEGEINKQPSMEKGSEIAALCSNCEVYFNKLYAEVLQETMPARNCKDIISYQLYAINCALMKIKLLNALRFTQ